MHILFEEKRKLFKRLKQMSTNPVELLNAFQKLKTNPDKIEDLVNMSDDEFEEIYNETNEGTETSQINDEGTGTSQINDEDKERNHENNPTHGLRFDDLKSAFKTFKGDNRSNISSWITHFEEQCAIFQMSKIRMFIFAKRMMEGAAKLFIEYESNASSWKQLKVELQQEFGQPVNSVLTHQKLSLRKKKLSESYLEYLYEMLAIGAQGNLDIPAIITHTINGLPGSPQMKSFLFDCQTLKDFKRKLSALDLQLAQSTQFQKQFDENSSKKEDHTAENSSNNRCKNCGFNAEKPR